MRAARRLHQSMEAEEPLSLRRLPIDQTESCKRFERQLRVAFESFFRQRVEDAFRDQFCGEPTEDVEQAFSVLIESIDGQLPGHQDLARIVDLVTVEGCEDLSLVAVPGGEIVGEA